MKNTLLNHLIDLFYPRLCIICERQLVVYEDHICSHCLHNMPETNFHLHEGNPMEQLFYGKATIERAFAWFYFNPEGDYRRLIHVIKYHGRKEAGFWLGYQYGLKLKRAGILTDIDLIVPVPLHKKRQRRRGYNQSEWIANGLGKALEIKTETRLLLRKTATETQTQKSLFERWLNTQDIFCMDRPLPTGCQHVLIVDDVVTTGATLLSCCKTLTARSSVKISVLTLAAAQ